MARFHAPSAYGNGLRVIVLLEGEPPAQSEVLSDLDQVFIISVLCSMSCTFPPDVTLRIEAEKVHGSIRPENLVSHSLRVL